MGYNTPIQALSVALALMIITGQLDDLGDVEAMKYQSFLARLWRDHEIDFTITFEKFKDWVKQRCANQYDAQRLLAPVLKNWYLESLSMSRSKASDSAMVLEIVRSLNLNLLMGLENIQKPAICIELLPGCGGYHVTVDKYRVSVPPEFLEKSCRVAEAACGFFGDGKEGVKESVDGLGVFVKDDRQDKMR